MRSVAYVAESSIRYILILIFLYFIWFAIARSVFGYCNGFFYRCNQMDEEFQFEFKVT